MSIRDSFLPDRFARIADAIAGVDVRSVREYAMAVRAEYVPVHDGFRDAVAATLSYLARTHGLETAERVGQLTIQRLMAGGEPPQYAQAGLRERVKAIAFGWHWHVTRITITEDEHKVTFRLHPCGSGMRLIQEGYYKPGPYGPPATGNETLPRLDRSSRATWSSFMREEFPIYCNHCSEMGHVGLAMGSASFMVEGWTPLRSSGICLQHTYKDPAFVPDEFYRRLDLPVPERAGDSVLQAAAPLFTAAELLDLQTHPLDKLIDRAERGDWSAALEALGECMAGWRDAIHDVYRNWLCGLWKIVHEELGDEAYEKTIRQTAPELFAHMRSATARTWAAYWSLHLRLNGIDEMADRGGVRFTIGQDSLLQPGGLPTDSAWFANQMTAGLRDRGRTDVGSFTAEGADFIHAFGEVRA